MSLENGMSAGSSASFLTREVLRMFSMTIDLEANSG